MPFADLANAIIDDLLRLQPERATQLGLHSYDDRLDDLSDSGQRELHGSLTDARDALDSLDTDSLGADNLDPEDVVDADMLRNGIDRELLQLDLLRETTWNPMVWLPGDALYPLIARDSVPLSDRLRSLASRLNQVPDRLAQAEATGRAGVHGAPRVHVETALLQLGGLITMTRDEVSALLTQEPSLRPLVEPAQQRALAALEQHRYVLTESLEAADGDPRLGADVFAAKLHVVLDSDLSVEQIQQRAQGFLAEVGEQLRELVGGDDAAVRAALDEVGRHAPDNDSIVGLARRAYAEATEAVREMGIVSIPDEIAEVMVMPESRRGVSVAYCDPPGPLETGGATFFAVSPTPADWSAQRVASFYREYNDAMVVNLSVHEAMPGHVLQLAQARTFHASTPIRHVFRSGSFIEGWAVHAERIMAEAGHGGRAVRLQQLKMQLRMTVNALLDVGVHAGGMTEAEAMELMMGRAFQEEGEAAGKWRRALLTSAQLSTYFVGYTELVPILAGRTTYDEVLAHGSPPPRHLATLLAHQNP